MAHSGTAGFVAGAQGTATNPIVITQTGTAASVQALGNTYVGGTTWLNSNGFYYSLPNVPAPGVVAAGTGTHSPTSPLAVVAAPAAPAPVVSTAPVVTASNPQAAVPAAPVVAAAPDTSDLQNLVTSPQVSLSGIGNNDVFALLGGNNLNVNNFWQGTGSGSASAETGQKQSDQTGVYGNAAAFNDGTSIFQYYGGTADDSGSYY